MCESESMSSNEKCTTSTATTNAESIAEEKRRLCAHLRETNKRMNALFDEMCTNRSRLLAIRDNMCAMCVELQDYRDDMQALRESARARRLQQAANGAADDDDDDDDDDGALMRRRRRQGPILPEMLVHDQAIESSRRSIEEARLRTHKFANTIQTLRDQAKHLRGIYEKKVAPDTLNDDDDDFEASWRAIRFEVDLVDLEIKVIREETKLHEDEIALASNEMHLARYEFELARYEVLLERDFERVGDAGADAGGERTIRSNSFIAA